MTLLKLIFMSNIIFETSGEKNNTFYTISLVAIDKLSVIDSKAFGELKYKVSVGMDEYIVVFSFDETNKKMNISLDTTALLLTKCLIGCGLSIVGSVLDCYEKNKDNWQNFVRCLESSGYTIGTGITGCILSCS
jgi:hypothetical protein